MIYRFKSTICNDVYLGETKRHFLVCWYEHLEKSILTEKNLKYIKKDATAIRKHCHKHCHTAYTSCCSLARNTGNKYHLKLKESFLKKHSSTVAKETVPMVAEMMQNLFYYMFLL